MESLIATFISVLFGLAFCKSVEGLYELHNQSNLDPKMWGLFIAFALNLIQAYLALLRLSEDNTARRIYGKGWRNFAALFLGCLIWGGYSFIALSLRDFNKRGNFPDYLLIFLFISALITLLYIFWDGISCKATRCLGKANVFRGVAVRWVIQDGIAFCFFSLLTLSLCFCPSAKGYLKGLSLWGILIICAGFPAVDICWNRKFLFTAKEEKE